MSEMPGGPWSDAELLNQKELEERLTKEGLDVYDPSTKSPDPDKRSETLGEVSLDAIHEGKPLLDRSGQIGLADSQPDTPVQAVQRADRLEQVRKTLDSINPIDAEVLVRRSTIVPETGKVETYESIASDLPRGDDKAEGGVTRERVRKRESKGKFNINRQLGRSGSAGHPFKDYRDGLDKH